MTPRPCTLITGASGLVGGEWLRTMRSRDPDRAIVVLTRRPELFPHAPVTAIGCDLVQDSPQLAERWQSSITEILHCAADIRFSISLAQARAANVEGTRRMLNLARRCPRLEKFAHISSVYAAGKLTGAFPEQPFPPARGFFNVYQQSKYEAEELVLDAMRDIPSAIFRLSSIVGNSQGEVRQFNYFHQLLKMIPNSGTVPVMPGDPAAPVDLIPSDWAVAALDCLFKQRWKAGRIYHVCAGPLGSLPVRSLVDIAFQRFGIRPPRLVSMAEFERFAASRRGSADGVVSEMLRVLEQFLPHLALYQSFQNDGTMADLAGAGLPVPRIESYYSRILDYCIRTNWGRSGFAPANGSVGAAEKVRRDSHPIQDLHGGPVGERAREAAIFKPPR